MTDEEFDEMVKKLFQLALEGGDLGYEYWSKVIKELKLMRQQALKAR
jgi:hypothetical protein